MKRAVSTKTGCRALIASAIVTFCISAGVRADEYDAAGSIAYMQQQFAVNPNDAISLSTGAATYSIPIEVPPGTGGMQPRIALTYNSQSKWGLSGYGWSISGLSTISRSTKKGVPKYNATDTFVLDGEELISVGTNVYNTKHQTFAKVQLQTGTTPNHWTVTHKDGTVHRYGATAGFAVEGVGKGTGTNAIRVWALDRITDTNGNYRNIGYSKDGVNGDYWPDAITYTHNTDGSLTTVRTVDFIWATGRSDQRTTYEEGAKVTNDRLLSGIDILVGASRLRRYVLTNEYSGSGGKSLLTQVQVCGSNWTSSDPGTCLPPTVFTYRALNNSFAATASYTGGSMVGIRYDYSKDMIDMDGDGRPDDVRRNINYTGDEEYHVRRNTGSAFGANVTYGNPFAVAGAHIRRPNYNGSWTYISYDTFDFDGDGIPDAVYRDGSAATEPFHILRGTGNGFETNEITFPAPSNLTEHYSLSVRSTQGSSYPNTVSDLLDMDGDGNLDVVLRNGSENWFVAKNSGTGFGNAVDWGPGQSSHVRLAWHSICYSDVSDLADMNGDGLPDEIYCTPSPGGVCKVRLNTGTGFAQTVASALSWGGIGYALRERVTTSCKLFTELLDMNGDRLPDLVTGAANANIAVYLNTGSEFETTAINWGISLYEYLAGSNRSLMDVNGDGLVDDVRGFNNPIRHDVKLNQATATDLLERVTVPTGGTLAYAYDSSASFTNTDADGKQRLPFPMWVVTKVTASDGLGGASIVTDYSYEGGLYDSEDKDFRGFREVEATDFSSGAYTKTVFLQGDACAGMVETVTRKSSAGATNPLSETTHWNKYKIGGTQYACGSSSAPETIAAGTITFAFTRTTQQKAYEGTASFKSAATELSAVDAFGNVTSKLDKGDDTVFGDEVLTTTQYAAAGSTNNIVNRPKYVKVEQGNSDTGSWTKKREQWFCYGTTPGDSPANCTGTATIVDGNAANVTQVDSWWDSTGGHIKETKGYDTYGNVLWTRDAKLNGDATPTIKTSTVVYDTTYRTFPTSVTNAEGHQALTGYDTLKRPTSVTDANGEVTSTTYDALSRPLTIVRPFDNSTYPTIVYTYTNATGTSPSITPARVMTKQREISLAAGTYDAHVFVDGLGRTIKTLKEKDSAAGQWLAVDTFYDGSGRKKSVSVPYQDDLDTSGDPRPTASTQPRVLYGYDDLNRVTSTKGPASTSGSSLIDNNLVTASTISYAPWQVTIKDAVNHQRVEDYDAYGRRKTIKEYNGTGTYTLYATTSYDYHDATGELTTITDNGANVYTFTYDSLGRKKSESDADRGTWVYCFDNNGNVTKQRDGNQYLASNPCTTAGGTDFEYDTLNRPTTKTLASGTSYVFTYDYPGAGNFRIGRLSWVEEYNSGGTQQWQRKFWYDERGRTRSNQLLMDGKTWTTNNTFDAADRPKTLVYPGGSAGQTGETVTFTYDPASNLESALCTSSCPSGVSSYLTDASYAAFGKVLSWSYGNSTVQNFDYYDASGEQDTGAGNNTFYSFALENLKVTKSASPDLLDFTYKYDKDGNILNLTDNEDATKNQVFAYDSHHRLITATGPYGPTGGQVTNDYTYNAIGNITNKDTGGVNKAYTYSALHRVSNDGTMAYTYDGGVANGNGSITSRTGGGSTHTFTYDAANRLATAAMNGLTENYKYDSGESRIRKCAGATCATGNERTYYIGPHYEERWTTTLQETTKHYFAGNQRIAERDLEGLSFINGDHLGSSSRLSDSTGAVANTYRYDPYGKDTP